MSRRAALLLVTLAFPACFDLPKVDPGNFVIDDFESGEDLTPISSRLGPWTSDTFPHPDPDGGADAGPEGDASCRVEGMGAQSAHALATHFQLTDPMDGTLEPGTVRVITEATHGTVDLTSFRLFVFDAHVESGTSMLPPKTQLTVELGCNASGQDFSAIQTVPMFNLDVGDWGPVESLQLNAFRSNRREFQACLQHVDSVRFTIAPGLKDGESANGTLFIDNISVLK